MDSLRETVMNYIPTWSANTSPNKEEGDASHAAQAKDSNDVLSNASDDPIGAGDLLDDAGLGDRKGVTMTESDEEAELSYPGTDDDEYEYDSYEDASEGDDGFPEEETEEEEAFKDVKEQDKVEDAPASRISFKDILLGKKEVQVTQQVVKKQDDVVIEKEEVEGEGDEEDEWETDEEEVETLVQQVETKPVAPIAEPAAKSSKPLGGISLPSRSRPVESNMKSNVNGTDTNEENESATLEKKPKGISLPERSVVNGPKASTSTKEEVPDSASESQDEQRDAPQRNNAVASPPATETPQTVERPTRSFAQFGQAVQERTEPEELSAEKKELKEVVMKHRVKLIRIAKRLRLGLDNQVIRQVIFRLDMTEQIKLHGHSSRAGVKETLREAENIAEDLERSNADLDLECKILVLGKSGVGKSTLINNMLGKEDEDVERHSGKTAIREVFGEVNGVRMHFIDVPGLQPCREEARTNRRILNAAKRAIKKGMPDIVLYVDRLDVPSYDFSDLPLIRDISRTFGNSIWWNALIVFTHGCARPPEDSSGQVSNLEYYQNHRGYTVQQTIRQAAEDVRILNPVSVVECHHATERNAHGEKLLPNGQSWKSYILLLCYASKVLADANASLKLDKEADIKQNKSRQMQIMALRRQQTPYPLFFNNLFQGRKPRRAQNVVEQDDLVEEEMNEMNEMEAAQAQEQDYPLNPFKQPLDQGDSRIDIPAPDPALAPTFDCDPTTNAHRYRYLENSNGWICRAIVEPDGLEHDDGINGFTAENYYGFVADPTSKDPRKQKPIPTYLMTQVNMPEKDKLSFVAEVESSVDSGKAPSEIAKTSSEAAKPDGLSTKKPITTTGGVDVQSLGREIMYVARTETRVKQSPKAKMVAGVSAFRSSTRLPTSGPLAFGAKVEERVKLGRRLRVNVTTGAIAGKAVDGKTNQYLKGANVQFMVKGNKKKNEPTKLQVIGTAMHWKKDVALGGDVQFIQMVGPDSALTARANCNSRGSGTVQVRVTSTDTIKWALVGVVPAVSALFNGLFNVF